MKSAADLSINVNTKYMFLIWAYEYLEEVSKTLKIIQKSNEITIDKILEKLITRADIISDSEEMILIDEIEVKSLDDVKNLLEKYRGFISSITLINIKLKVTLVEFLIFADIYYMSYVNVD